MARPIDHAAREVALCYAEYLRTGLVRAKLSCSTLARQVGLQENKLQRIARGLGGPPKDTNVQQKIERVLGQSFDLRASARTDASPPEPAADGVDWTDGWTRRREIEHALEVARRDLAALLGVRPAQVKIRVDL